jgi:peptidoglycan/LPS O-acetylase OafA/YrhL
MNATGTYEKSAGRESSTGARKRGQLATNLKYRPDIDGLRAMAVLLVICGHLRTRFRGGYIGVDVFFVISGYLISSVIISEITEGKFSIAGFYERRIRRILPALLFTLAGTASLVYRYSGPIEAVQFAKSVLAAQFSVSNFFFLSGRGYFAAPTSLMPLLHTWSLSVEEQFYIFFPIFLVLVRRYLRFRLKASIWEVVAVSFGLACIWVRRDASIAFFLAPLRAWELLIGTIVSQRYLPAIQNNALRNLVSLAGISLVLLPSLFYTAETPFPGLAALPPCIGAALIIAAGETGPSLVGRLLSWRPFVFVGLISYSLYLWHWPILVFQRTNHMLVDAPIDSKEAKLAVFLLSLFLATLTWRFVETPFRKGRYRPGRRTLLWISGSAFAVVGLLAVVIIGTNGLTFRFSGQALAVSQYAGLDPDLAYRAKGCFLEPETSFSRFPSDICLKKYPGRRQFLLLGDSHAAQLYPGLSSTFPEINVSEATVAQCRPFVTPKVHSKATCKKMSAYIYGDYLLRNHVDAVLLGGRWEDSEMPELERTVAWIEQHGMKVVVFGPNIEFDVPLPHILAFALRDGEPSKVFQHRTTHPQLLDEKLALLVRNSWGARYVSFFEDLCMPNSTKNRVDRPDSNLVCPVTAGSGVPLLFDTDHLTPEASTYYAKVMRMRGELP